jgi:hypothetical protein
MKNNHLGRFAKQTKIDMKNLSESSHKSNLNHLHLSGGVLCLVMSLSYFSFGGFILSRLLGIHVIIYFFYFALFLLLSLNNYRIRISLLFLLTTCVFLIISTIHQMFFQSGAFLLFMLFVAATQGRQKMLTSISKNIVLIALFFSLSSLLMWIVVFGKPDLIALVSIIDNEAIEGGKLLLSDISPLGSLGLSTNEPIVLMGHQIARLKSFLKEPSVAPIFFAIPLALGLKLKMRKSVCFLSVFLFLTFSASVYLIVLVFFFNAYIYKLFGSNIAKIFIISEVFLLFLLPILFSMMEDLLQFIYVWSNTLDDYKLYGRINSGIKRLQILSGMLNEFAFSNLILGGGERHYAAGGIIGGIYKYGILLELILCFYILNKKLNDIADVLFFSTWIVGLTVTSYGFFGFNGFLSIYLFKELDRLRENGKSFIPV